MSDRGIKYKTEYINKSNSDLEILCNLYWHFLTMDKRYENYYVRVHEERKNYLRVGLWWLTSPALITGTVNLDETDGLKERAGKIIDMIESMRSRLIARGHVKGPNNRNT